ncbi:MAG: DNA primase [Betaproteobacteria bacterium]
MFSDDIISRVRDSIDIIDLISGYVSLKKTGKNNVGLCPFHAEKTPSFSVNPDKQIFHCFGCGVGGDVFKFLELQEGLSFPEAVKRLADRTGIRLPADSRPHREDKKAGDERAALLKIVADAADYFSKELDGPVGSAARAYLKKRGVSDAIIKNFALGFSTPEWDGLLRHLKQKGYASGLMEKAGLIVKRSEGDGHYDRFRGRIIFPIRDISGNVIAFGGRVMDDSLPKYLNSPETPLYSKSNVLYCLDKAKEPARKYDHFIIVEGYLDAIACHQYGVSNATATLGTALTEGHLRLMRRFTKNLKLIFDPDPAGVKAALRSFDLLVGSGMNVKVVSLPGGDDPDTFLKKNGYDSFIASLKDAVPLMDFVLGQVVKGGAGTAIGDKVTQAGEMLGFIAKLPSSIEQNHYLKKTAEALDVSEADLRQEMAKVAKPETGTGRTQAGVSGQHRRPKAEESLIHLMLKDEKIARSLRGQIRPQDFTDPLFRRAAERIFEVLRSKGALELRSLLDEGDEELNGLLSHYAVLERVYEDPEKSCRDCVDFIKQQDPEKKIKLLSKAIQAAEARGDRAEFIRLTKEQQELSRRPGRRIPGL